MVIALPRFLLAPVGPMAGFPAMPAISYTRRRFGWSLAFAFLVVVAVSSRERDAPSGWVGVVAGLRLEDTRADGSGVKGGDPIGSEERVLDVFVGLGESNEHDRCELPVLDSKAAGGSRGTEFRQFVELGFEGAVVGKSGSKEEPDVEKGRKGILLLESRLQVIPHVLGGGIAGDGGGGSGGGCGSDLEAHKLFAKEIGAGHENETLGFHLALRDTFKLGGVSVSGGGVGASEGTP